MPTPVFALLVAGCLLGLAVPLAATFQEPLEADLSDSLSLLAQRKSQVQRHNGPPKIPANVIFNYKFDLLKATPEQLEGEHLQLLKKNCEHTIASFRGDVEKVYFWTNEMCAKQIREVEGVDGEKFDGELLATGFDRMKDGKYKSDLCRLVQLYKHGGYYFDTDIIPVVSLRRLLPPDTTFAAVKGIYRGQVVQAFLATTAANPMIAANLHTFERWFAGTQTEDEPKWPRPEELGSQENLGPKMLWREFELFSEEFTTKPQFTKDGEVLHFFSEYGLKELRERRIEGVLPNSRTAKDCNVGMIDEASQQLVMYSRVISSRLGRECNEQLGLIKRDSEARGYEEAKRVGQSDEEDPQL